MRPPEPRPPDEGRLTLTDMASCEEPSLLLSRLRCQMKVQTAMTTNWADKKTVAATIKPAMLMQRPVSLVGRNMASFPVVVVDDLFVSRSKPNLSVIWMVCTSNMSSWAACDVERRRRRFPYETTERRSPLDSSWSHWTGSHVGMQGVTRARNWTTSEDGNLKASKWDRRI